MNQKGTKRALHYLILAVGILIVLGIVGFVSMKGFGSNITGDWALSWDSTEPSNLENIFLENITVVKMKLPAINEVGKGMFTILTVESIKKSKGEGRTLVDIDNLLFWGDTQQSIRTARYVANNFTEKNVKDYDLIYSIEANASVIGGPSAGAAITLATISALRDDKPKDNVMMTGTINPDSTIGPIGGILEKARASKESGAILFLVPPMQSIEWTYEPRERCNDLGFTKICTIETIPRKVNIQEEVGIEVIEVSSVSEALKYFY